MKLHLGCGSKVLKGWTNIDAFVKSEEIFNWDILSLPIESESIDEVLAEHLVEHLGFAEEPLFFREMYRVLKADGTLKVEVPDMEWVFEEFINGEDYFKDFYQAGAVDHYFGNGRETNNRWSLLTTAIWGNQNGAGQFHKNGYTERKLERIAKMVGFSDIRVEKAFNKGTQVLIATFKK